MSFLIVYNGIKLNAVKAGCELGFKNKTLSAFIVVLAYVISIFC